MIRTKAEPAPAHVAVDHEYAPAPSTDFSALLGQPRRDPEAASLLDGFAR